MTKSGEPRWLDEEEEQAWLALAASLFMLPTALDAQLQRDSGMTLYEYLVLASLSEAPERSLQMSDLAVITNGSLPRLSQVVTKLEKRGWVRRQKSATDGRVTLAVLTQAGRNTLDQSAPGHVETVRRLIFDPLSRTQVRQLRTIHRRIKSAIAPHGALLAGASDSSRRS